VTPRRLRYLTGAAAIAASTILVLAVSGPATAHGYTITPASRAYRCAQGTVTGCGDIQYEPQSVEGPKGFPAAGPPDGSLCSAGIARFAQLDDPRGGAWPTSTLTSGASYQFHWHLTAQHATTSFAYYLTNTSYDPTKPLTRAQLASTPFLTVPYNGAAPPVDVTHTGTLPSGRHGRALILSVWTIADTGNAFYQCADVTFG
jgi:predicted carbohydrate-binding protein with CBM5 and CBM33 domain